MGVYFNLSKICKYLTLEVNICHHVKLKMSIHKMCHFRLVIFLNNKQNICKWVTPEMSRCRHSVRIGVNVIQTFVNLLPELKIYTHDVEPWLNMSRHDTARHSDNEGVLTCLCYTGCV